MILSNTKIDKFFGQRTAKCVLMGIFRSETVRRPNMMR